MNIGICITCKNKNEFCALTVPNVVVTPNKPIVVTVNNFFIIYKPPLLFCYYYFSIVSINFQGQKYFNFITNTIIKYLTI